MCFFIVVLIYQLSGIAHKCGVPYRNVTWQFGPIRFKSSSLPLQSHLFKGHRITFLAFYIQLIFVNRNFDKNDVKSKLSVFAPFVKKSSFLGSGRRRAILGILTASLEGLQAKAKSMLQ